MSDYYEILGLQRNATDTQLKQAYRKLAFQYHPDKSKDDASIAIFRDLSSAYAILSNPKKRAIYDTYGLDGLNGLDGGADKVDPLKLFRSLFNVDFTRDLNENYYYYSDFDHYSENRDYPKGTLYEIECTLDDLYNGTQKQFFIKNDHHSGGYIINIRAGSRVGEYILVRRSDQDEDLIIALKEIPHTIYKRKGDDLYREYILSLSEALCGFQITIDHFGEPLTLSYDGIVKPNSLFRVCDQGMPLKIKNTLSLGNHENNESDRGDLILDLYIAFPEALELTNDQMQNLCELLGQSRRAKNNDPNNDQAKDQAKDQVIDIYYYKNKEDVVKEMLDEEENESGSCLQQ